MCKHGWQTDSDAFKTLVDDDRGENGEAPLVAYFVCRADKIQAPVCC